MIATACSSGGLPVCLIPHLDDFSVSVRMLPEMSAILTFFIPMLGVVPFLYS